MYMYVVVRCPHYIDLLKTYIVIYTCTCRFLSFAFNCAFIIQWQLHVDYSFIYKSVQYYTLFEKTHELKAQYL